MPNRFDRDWDERNRGEFSAGPFGRRGELEGDYARDNRRDFGGDYARDRGWSGGGGHEDYARDERWDHARDGRWGGTGAAGDWTGAGWRGGAGSVEVGYGPARGRGTYGSNDLGGSAAAYGGDTLRPTYRGKGPKNWRRSDERIREAINELLTEHDGIDATDVDVRVENAEVTLEGQVGSRWEKRLAEDIAASCGGVHDVHNRLRVADREVQVGKASE